MGGSPRKAEGHQSSCGDASGVIPGRKTQLPQGNGIWAQPCTKNPTTPRKWDLGSSLHQKPNCSKEMGFGLSPAPGKENPTASAKWDLGSALHQKPSCSMEMRFGLSSAPGRETQLLQGNGIWAQPCTSFQVVPHGTSGKLCVQLEFVTVWAQDCTCVCEREWFYIKTHILFINRGRFLGESEQ